METTTMTYELTMRDDSGSTEAREVEAESLAEAVNLAEDECRDWAEDGEWGDGGASVAVYYTLADPDGDELPGVVHVEIGPDHAALIRQAGGDPRCDHDWTSDGEGGSEENPGVWSSGGTVMVFSVHCRKCGLRQVHTDKGSRRDPGEADTWHYSQPDSWCPECESEGCECDEDDGDDSED